MCLRFIKALILLFFCSIAFSHEYVFIPYHWRLHTGDVLELHLFVADGFNVQLERPLQKEMTNRFELITSDGNQDLLTSQSEGAFPIYNYPINFKGQGLLHLERSASKIILQNEKFAEYLKEDHMKYIHPDYKNHSEQSERYLRYIKSLVQSDPIARDTTYRTIVGQRFEIILLNDPYKLKIGQRIHAQIWFDHKPMKNKTVTIRQRTGGLASTHQFSTTDSSGICSFLINHKGDWFIHATHMIPCPDQQDALWESHWASYSFGIGF